MKYHFLFYSQVKMSCTYVHSYCNRNLGFYYHQHSFFSLKYFSWNYCSVLKNFNIDLCHLLSIKLTQMLNPKSKKILRVAQEYFEMNWHSLFFTYIAANSGSTLTVKLSIPNHANYQWTMKHQNMILLKKHFQYSAQFSNAVNSFLKHSFCPPFEELCSGR